MDADLNSPLAPVNITPMSASEARECIEAIKGNLESLRLMLLELHRRRGWEALGYSSWEECALAEFGKSRAYTFRLLAAASVEENLASATESTIVDLENLPVSHLTELAKLPPEQQAEGLLKAEEIASAEGKKRNATHVAQAVKEIKQIPLGTVAPTATQPPKTESNPSSVDEEDVNSFAANLPQQADLNTELSGNVFAQYSSETLVLHSWTDADLLQLIKNAKEIIKKAEHELSQRHHSHPEYESYTSNN